MRIALDGRLWNIPNAEERFLGAGIIPYLVQVMEGHELFVTFDQPPPPSFKNEANINLLILKPKARSAATRAIWYDVILPPLLVAQKIDLFIGFAGYISLRTKVPQLLWMNDALSEEGTATATGWGGILYKRRLKSMLQKANGVVVPSQWTWNQLAQNVENKARVIPAGPIFFPESLLDESRKDAIKSKLTQGMEYFVCIEGWQQTENALELLLAFAAFKKRQQTGMKLVLMGIGPKDKFWLEKLKTYRYRDDLILTDERDLTARLGILSAAYGLVHLPAQPGVKYLEYAFKLGVPVITLPQDSIQERATDAVLYCSDEPGYTLAQCMMRLYKDEQERAGLIKKGFDLAKDLEPENWAQLLIQAGQAAYLST